jgi:osmoprotectant transport system permease protein
MTRHPVSAVSLLLLVTTLPTAAAGDPPTVIIGSKKFTEPVIIGDMLQHLAEAGGARAEHRKELGGTEVLWKALVRGDIDIYVEYTGTLHEVILKGDQSTQEQLDAFGIEMSGPLGFNNTYAIGLLETYAAAKGIAKISDLRHHPELRLGFSDEFMQRADGWPGLRDRYSLPQQNVKGIDHDLAYRAMRANHLDGTDLYSTDADVLYYKLRTLEDDRGFFPEYRAVLLYRKDLEKRAPQVMQKFRLLEGAISEPAMMALNAAVKIEGKSESQVAADFIHRQLGVEAQVEPISAWQSFLARTRQHLFLVCTSLAAAVLVAVPLGIVAATWRIPGQVILGIVGIVQTIPSLALLVFLIPLLGIGDLPAIVALFLYSLLPIVRNTYTGLHDIPIQIRESAEALGLPPLAKLRLVELPMTTRSILAGVKTSAVINVGTATLGALIGAGGYGQPILTGIRLDNVGLILQGAIPAAVLALLVHGVFELAEQRLVSGGLRHRRAR